MVRVCRDRARAGLAGVAAADLINQHLEADGVRLCCVNKWRSVGPARFSTIRFSSTVGFWLVLCMTLYTVALLDVEHVLYIRS